jgi:hypothetical protein
MSARDADMIVHEVGSGDAAGPAAKRESSAAARRCPRREAKIRSWLGIAQSEQVRFEADVGGESRQQSSYSRYPASHQRERFRGHEKLWSID